MSRRFHLLLVLLFLPFVLFAKPAKKVWVIDAGHGGNDHGCEYSGMMEKDINLKIAKRVSELIKANMPKVSVVLTREYDRYLTLDQRCVKANNAGAELFLSIHVNAAPDYPSLSGTETFYGPKGGTTDKELERLRKKNIQKSELLAWMMQKYYGLAGRPISRGVKQERYYVTLYTKMPAILTEIGFITNQKDNLYMSSKEGVEQIAQCIYLGLKDYDETVANDKIQSTLAKLRNSGGKVKDTEVPALVPEKLLATNTTPAKVEKHEPATPVTTTTNTEPNTPAAKTETTKPAENTSQATASTTAQSKEDAVLVGTEEPEELDDPLQFSVQIFSLRAKLDPSDTRFKGLKDLLVVEREGLYKYLCGTTQDYAGARKLLAEVRKTFPDAFLVAYKGGRQISMSDAIEMVSTVKK